MSSTLLCAGVLLACAFTLSAAQTSCKGRCGAEYYRGYMCQCDYTCLLYGECCDDYESQCTTKNSCKGRCGESFKRGRGCTCDSDCSTYKQCCEDHTSHCDAEDEDSTPLVGLTSYLPDDSSDDTNNQLPPDLEDTSPVPEGTSGYGSSTADALDHVSTEPTLQPDTEDFTPETVTVISQTETTQTDDEPTDSSDPGTTLAEATTEQVSDQPTPTSAAQTEVPATASSPEPETSGQGAVQPEDDVSTAAQTTALPEAFTDNPEVTTLPFTTAASGSTGVTEDDTIVAASQFTFPDETTSNPEPLNTESSSEDSTPGLQDPSTSVSTELDAPTTTKPTEEPQPSEPTEQPQPSEPTEEPQPSEPTEQPQPSEPTERPQPSEPTEQPQPSEPTEQPQLSEPTEQPETTKPTEEPQPSEPTEQTQPSEPTEQPQPSEPTEQPQPSEPTEQPQPSEHTEQPQPSEHTEQTQPTKPTEQPEITKPTEQPETTKPTEQPETTKPTEQPETTKPTEQPETTKPTEQPETTKPTEQPETTKPTEQPQRKPLPLPVKPILVKYPPKHPDNPGDYQADDSNDTNLCSGRPPGAVTTLRNGTVVVFRGHYFWLLNSRREPGPARGITQVWGVPSPIDTVFTRCSCQGKTYMFKGSQYWRFDNDALDSGYPKVIETGFDGLRGHITAALSVPQYNRRTESVYFFKRGGQVQKYSYQFGTSPSCGKKVQYPVHNGRVRMVRQAVSALGPVINIRTSWRGFPTSITAAVSVPSTREPQGYKYYVFSRSKSYSVSLDGSRPVMAAAPAGVSPQSSNFIKCPRT
ncbi:proteoglycan 4b isoform X2 [Limanda limanda]|uniref:proteoglycan 4b isoform X2 n=1 Tax=Limanda limanda TaxID=27771 RepID=UPI0029C94402|nr:proteoglycan 4b isoform X2 [Limanda limanda]